MDPPRRHKCSHWPKESNRAALLQEFPISVREADDVGVGAQWHRGIRQKLPQQGLDNFPEVTINIKWGAL